MKRQLFFVCPFSCLFSGFSVYFCRVFYAGNAAMAYTLLYYGSIKGYISCHGSPHRYGVGCYFRFVKDSSFVWHSTVRDILSPLSPCLYRNNSVCSEKTLVQERQARNAHGVARNNRRFCIFPFREHSSPIHFGGQRVSFGFLHSFAHCFALHMDGTRRETHPPPRTRFHSCLCGRALVVINDWTHVQLKFAGDILALLAALMWAFYQHLTKHAYAHYSAIFITRKVFAYGLLSIIIYFLFFPPTISWGVFSHPTVIVNLAFLGIIASCACFLAWNLVIGNIGSVASSNYLYLQPLIAASVSAVVLGEPVTWVMIIGMVLIIAGVYWSERQ